MAENLGLQRRAVIFDLDGTLVDSAPDMAAAVNAVLEEEGLAPLTLEEATSMIGDGAARLVQRAFVQRWGKIDETRLAEDLVPRFLAHYDQVLVVESRAYPGAVSTLAALSRDGWRLGLCTNKPEEPSRKIAAALGFEDLLSVIVGGDSLTERKPAAAPLLAAIERLQADPSRSFMVGDSANDVLAARRARLPVIAVSFGYSAIPARELGADLVIDGFQELPGAIQGLIRD